MLKFDKDLFSECIEFMARIKQVRYLKTLTRWLKKFPQCQHKQYRGVCSNQNNHTHKASSLNNKLHNNSNTRAIKELKTNRFRIVLTADKRVAMVVMGRQDYIKKAQVLLEDKDTYRPTSKDPTSKLDIQLIHLLKNNKSQGWVDQATYKRLYASCAIPAKFYRLPKIN